MAKYFSAETNSFYDSEFGVVPEGATEVTQEVYDDIMVGVSKGFVIGHDGNNQPILVPMPAPSDEILLQNCKAEAKNRLAQTDWSQTADIGELLVNQADFTAYRAAVRVIYFNPVTAPVWPIEPVAVWKE